MKKQNKNKTKTKIKQTKNNEKKRGKRALNITAVVKETFKGLVLSVG